MRALLVAALLVPLIDQGVKLAMRRGLGTSVVSLGPLGHLRVVTARLWVTRVARRASPTAAWALWTIAAAALVVASAWIPSSRFFVGLLLGGSLSNAIESSLRGGVTDYVCLRFWPAFNLADVALTAGGVGVAATLAIAVR